MTCAELMDLLADYVGEELVVEHRETVTLHMRGCPKCEVYAATYSHTIRVVRALPRCGTLSPAFEARLRAALAEHLAREEQEE